MSRTPASQVYYGAFNYYLKEVRRFLKVYNQTLLTPLINILLLWFVFNIAVRGGTATRVGDVESGVFIFSGLIMMSVIQNAFSNTSSSLVMSRLMNYINDFLIPPVPMHLKVLALNLSGITRGFMIAIIGLTFAFIFLDVRFHSIPLMLFYIIISSSILSSVGIITGLASNSFDKMSAISSYIISPLSFLSGTFYSVKQLPAHWYWITANTNPFFYMVDGFRFSVTGYTDGNIQFGMIYLTIFSIVLYSFTSYLCKIGYGLKN